MVQAAQPRCGRDAGLKWRTPYGSFGRSALVQANVSPVLVVIGKVVTPKPPKVIFVQRNDRVEQFAARAAHPTFRRSVLPGAPNVRAYWLESTRS